MRDAVIKLYTKAILTFAGNEAKFSLEHRVFNLFSAFVSILSVFSLLLNLLLGLYGAALLAAVVILIQSIVFYLSRVENKLRLSVIITGIVLHMLMALNYPINGGIQGPTVTLFLAVLFLMTSVAERKSIWFWLTLNFSLMALLFLMEYLHPEWILVGYTERLAIFSDVYACYTMVVILMATGILYTRIAYNKQRMVLQTEALALEKLNSEKNKLFSIISHDLRAPIGSIKQYFSFLKDNSLTDEEKQLIENGLIKSTDEAYELLDNLLVWAKTQLGGSKPFIAHLNVSKTLESIVSQVETAAEQKGIRLITQIGNVGVAADKNMLQLVIRNLLLNAIKFSVSGDVIDFIVYVKEDQAIFKIEDSGIGISEELKKAIFSLDVKSNLGTQREKGTGLGLVLCKEYTQLQNGKIWFESELGIGSTFFVSLPAVSQ